MTVAITILLGFLRALPYIAVVTGALWLYNVAIDNPRVASEARAGYVQEAEAIAAKAELAERKRQFDAAEAAVTEFKIKLGQMEAQQAESDHALDEESDAYEAELAKDKRSCPLSAADVKRILGK